MSGCPWVVRRSGKVVLAALSLAIGTFCNVIATLRHRHCYAVHQRLMRRVCQTGTFLRLPDISHGEASTMANGQDWDQPGQYPQEGYGQPGPQGQPWQPQQYDPGAHQQRMGHGQRN